MAAKLRNEIDLLIEILEEAALRSIDAETRGEKQRSPQELRVIMDLIDEKMVRGENLSDHDDPLMPRGAALRGINLKGRRYLQELKDYKRDRGWRGTMDKAGWIIFSPCSFQRNNHLHQSSLAHRLMLKRNFTVFRDIFPSPILAEASGQPVRVAEALNFSGSPRPICLGITNQEIKKAT
jgi:hypothetical protein